MAFCESRLEYDPESEIEMDSIFESYKKFCSEKLIPIKQENYFFQGVYKYFGHKVYKKRKRDDFGGESRRWFVIVGLDWRENK